MLASASAKGDHLQIPTSAESFGLDKPGIPQEIDGDTPVIPPTHANRTLVVCFDGAGNQFGNDNSNVVQLVALMKQDDRQQLVYYQSGIGRYTSPHSSQKLSGIKKPLDTMIAWSLRSHIIGGYEFLVQNYIPGDKICLFGFSRGAYSARCLVGMLHKVGLLPAGHLQQVGVAYKIYKRTDEVGWRQSNSFKKAFCVAVPIEFMGVWDTADSAGIIPERLPFTSSNTIVRTVRHAVSLDERRAKFKINLLNLPTRVEAKLGTVTATTAMAGEQAFDDLAEGSRTQNLNTLERLSHENEKQTDVLEVWFAGCHCDVGGGSVSSKTRHSLARIPLRWMVRECFKATTGIMFHSEKLLEIGLDPTTLYPYVLPRPPALSVNDHRIRDPPATGIRIQIHKYLTKKNHQRLLEHAVPFLGSEEEEEVRDAVSPKYDQLKKKKGWWLFELLPMTLRYQRSSDEWVSEWRSNLGGARYIPQQRRNGFNVHRSVKLRMEAEYENETKRRRGKRYAAKPEWKVQPTYID